MQNVEMITKEQEEMLKNLHYSGYYNGVKRDLSTLTKIESAEIIRQLRTTANRQQAQAQEVVPTPQPNPQPQPQTYAPQQVQPQQQVLPAQRKSFSNWMSTVGNRLVSNALSDVARQKQFIASIVSAVSNNPALRECQFDTIISGALQGESLKLPIGLGYYYLVPFKNKKKTDERRMADPKALDVKDAQFQIGYKGYIQLAIRSGQYKDISVLEVKEGELKEYNPLSGLKFEWISDYTKRQKAKTIGYVARIELVNGFEKIMYSTYEEILEHADKYSQAFSKQAYLAIQNGTMPQKDMWRYSSFWYKNFDEMAKKTMLRKILSKWGIMSVELQSAYNTDQAVVSSDGSLNYIDNNVADDERRYANVEDVYENQYVTMGTAEL